jgi:hypothetical protein
MRINVRGLSKELTFERRLKIFIVIKMNMEEVN